MAALDSLWILDYQRWFFFLKGMSDVNSDLEAQKQHAFSPFYENAEDALLTWASASVTPDLNTVISPGNGLGFKMSFHLFQFYSLLKSSQKGLGGKKIREIPAYSGLQKQNIRWVHEANPVCWVSKTQTKGQGFPPLLLKAVVSKPITVSDTINKDVLNEWYALYKEASKPWGTFSKSTIQYRTSLSSQVQCVNYLKLSYLSLKFKKQTKLLFFSLYSFYFHVQVWHSVIPSERSHHHI